MDPTGKLIAPTFACPPPPYRSQIVARLCFSGSFTHGFDPTETLVRKLAALTETVYTDSGNKSYGMNLLYPSSPSSIKSKNTTPRSHVACRLIIPIDFKCRSNIGRY